MIIAYASLTGKVKNFTERLHKQFPDSEIIHVRKDTKINEPFVLITYTFGSGDIPVEVKSFLANNSDHIIAVAGSGERNWGAHRFCKASIDISKQFNVPLLHTFEKMGFDSDIDIVANKLRELKG
ncbi:class Ib ribonucleoside-diphosphate reductase assembly flavoprotein NrdI [Bacillus paranthracis]|uniref:class Ib ribonucleoside-diphosphate reductase assembly flavoprotein NrdI n=1 Tax=Bacillus paranthracis TaxID=2026186 RepID=UPI002D7781E2|nr:class Ib ribonucleoside-diphosphate reductase assembly flavoprotein NrdI [Bacillus paranthracis]